MPLSAEAEGKIRALVTSGINFSNHVANSDHFDEDSAYESARNFGRGADGLGPCSFFAFDNDSEPSIHQSADDKIVDPGAFTGQDAKGFTLTGKTKTAARKAHEALANQFNYRTRKANLRAAVEGQLQASWDANNQIDKHALIKAFLLQKKSNMSSRKQDDRLVVTGYIPWGFVGWIIEPGVRKDFGSYEYTDRMTVVIGGGGGNPQVITAYPSR